MSDMVKIRGGELRLGEPLPYSVYDVSGLLLLKEGFVVTLQRHLDALVQRGLYYDASRREQAAKRAAYVAAAAVEEHNVFEMLELMKVRLQRIFDNYRSDRYHEEFRQRVEDLSLEIQEAVNQDLDASLASLNLDYDSSYSVVHHLQAALVCELVAKKMGITEEARSGLINAALTHDIGLLDVQDLLDKQTAPLTPQQKERINQHPLESVKRLHTLGVTDALWLGATAHHHERIDGSGYPEGLSAADIKAPARILAVADIYSAMIRDRPYRKAMVSSDAMRSMLSEQGEKSDATLTKTMIKELGVFPPGALVKLANNEIAVVKRRQENSAYPIVYSFVNKEGMPILSPMKRDTVQPDFRVSGMVKFSEHKSCLAIIRGIWNRKD